MANDKRDGDELFEDLDKFFAPIKDVDWDEPEEPAVAAPTEEHVTVRTEPSTPTDVVTVSVTAMLVALPQPFETTQS